MGRGRGDTVDFELERQGQQLVVSAGAWKSARIGLETLRGLQTAREAADGAHALCICLGDLTDTARPFAARHGITIWQAPELAQALKGCCRPPRVLAGSSN
ncbi:MAG: restriction endonuclease [Rubrivivax sp.]|nr:restriction endonuclease [Rubrivivax sp.]